MSVRGLSDLIVTIMAAGEVRALPARDHRRCHEALMSLVVKDSPVAEQLWARYGGVPTWYVTARYGRHVEGVTPALWELVNRDLLSACEAAEEPAYVLNAAAEALCRRELLRLPVDQADLVFQAGVVWAAASTSRKKPASPWPSPDSTRRARLA